MFFHPKFSYKEMPEQQPNFGLHNPNREMRLPCKVAGGWLFVVLSFSCYSMSIIAEESAWLPEEVKADKNIFFLSFLLSAGKHNNNEEQSLCLMKGDQNRSHTLSRTLPKSCEEVNPENILLMKRSSSLFLLFYFCNLLIGKATIVLPSLFFLWVIHIQKKKRKRIFCPLYLQKETKIQ